MLKRIIRRGIEEMRGVYSLFALLLPSRIVTALADEALRLRHRLNDVVRRRAARANPEVLPPLVGQHHPIRLQREVLERRTSWSGLEIADCPIPTMLTQDEKRYYHYITNFYSGTGAVVEIGPWIGSSTYNILGGLSQNPAFTSDKRLYVYDDFVWRSSWMDKWLVGTGIAPLANGASFLPLFSEMMARYANRLQATAMKLMDAGDNDHVPWFKWDRGLVELCFIDCGRALAMNETWYRTLEPYFIPDQTIIVMQDWQNFKNVPEQYWENTKIFTDSKGERLDLIHELKNSGTASFVYRGKPNHGA
ncbi:MAG: hypothetical protein R8J85_01730 [Mariprofundales bacterium]